VRLVLFGPRFTPRDAATKRGTDQQKESQPGQRRQNSFERLHETFLSFEAHMSTQALISCFILL
jgi:hypothetical protein